MGGVDEGGGSHLVNWHTVLKVNMGRILLFGSQIVVLGLLVSALGRLSPLFFPSSLGLFFLAFEGGTETYF